MNKIANFEPTKKKALITATTEQAFEESRAVLEPMATMWPAGAVALNVLLASVGTVIKYKQEVLNQFTQFLMDNPDVYTDEVVNSKAFQDGLVVFINSYFKLRSDEKLEYARRVFHDFGKSKEMPIYPLERYDDTLEKISESGIRFLGFVSEKVPDISAEYVASRMRRNSNVATDEESMERFRQNYVGNKPLSFFINEYIKKLADEYAREHSSLYAKAFGEKTDELQGQYWTIVSELEQLGLINTYIDRGLGWDAVQTSEYALTDYGKKFTSVIRP